MCLYFMFGNYRAWWRTCSAGSRQSRTAQHCGAHGVDSALVKALARLAARSNATSADCCARNGHKQRPAGPCARRPCRASCHGCRPCAAHEQRQGVRGSLCGVSAARVHLLPR